MPDSYWPEGPGDVSGPEMPCEVTVLMPCLDEAETIAICIKKAQAYMASRGISGEVLIADNGSTDGSQAIAEGLGARVVAVAEKGYGSALLGGIAAAKGRYVIQGDADDSYDFSDLSPFIEKLREGYALVMGNRFKGGIKPGAMPPLHRYLGNPVLTGFGRLFFNSPVGDFHCGLRGFDRQAVAGLGLTSSGMEFASEMVVKATLQGLTIAEVPTTLSPDGRSRAPHLRSWRDGWRHLRFLLLFSPRWLFLYPGALLMARCSPRSTPSRPGCCPRIRGSPGWGICSAWKSASSSATCCCSAVSAFRSSRSKSGAAASSAISTPRSPCASCCPV